MPDQEPIPTKQTYFALCAIQDPESGTLTLRVKGLHGINPGQVEKEWVDEGFYDDAIEDWGQQIVLVRFMDQESYLEQLKLIRERQKTPLNHPEEIFAF